MTEQEAITIILTHAREAGELANHGEDGGTCNFDAAAIHLPRRRAATVEAAAEAAGVSVWKPGGGLWSGYWIVNLPAQTGQGNRRTRVAEAMAATIKGGGYDATVYYQMD